MPLHAKTASGLTFPWAAAPAPAALTEVAPGVHWLRMPLPLALDHINLWLLEGAEGWTLVDCGMATETTRGLWRELFDGAASSLPPRDVIATHFHPDHLGLAGWLASEYGLPLAMTETEHRTARLIKGLDDATFVERLRGFFLPHGLDSGRMEMLAGYGNAYARSVELPPAEYRRIADNEVLEIGGRHWRVIVGRGHAPEHAALYCEELRVLICGDLLLPQITPNISTEWFDQESDHLADYLTSLTRFWRLPEDTLVLPSHRLPYRGLHARIREIEGHHEERLQRVLTFAGAEPFSAAEVLPVIFDRPLEGYQVFFALGEAVAHLDHLVNRGALAVTRETGRIRYRSA
jgi:glyoxylase-like metal-dependent hydrolase (beta-lactamase superfamily II)